MTKRLKPIVIDTSIIVKWLNKEKELHIEQADRLFQDARGQKIELFAPELAKYETGNAILYKGISLPESKQSMVTLYTIPIKFVLWDEEVALETMKIAHETKITYCDASFLALAKKIKASLVTENPKHQKPTLRDINVIPLKDWKV